MTDKLCKTCKELKSLDEFSNSQAKRKTAHCRACVKKNYLEKYDKANKERLYKIYHENNKGSFCIDCGVPCHKDSKRCKPCSSKTNGKNRKRNPKLCEKCGSELAKRKYKLCHSCNMKNRWNNEEYGKKTRASISKSFDARWADPNVRRKIVKQLTTTNGTSKLEKYVAKFAADFGFEHSVVVGRYIADILNEGKKIIVEVNGDLWHCNPAFWKADDIHPNKKITASKIWERDLKRKEYLEEIGYTVYVLWECDINKGKKKFLKDFFEKIANETKGSNQRDCLS